MSPSSAARRGPSTSGASARQVSDGLSNTILVVESTGLAIPWTEPRDLEFKRLDFKLNSPTGHGVGGKHRLGTNVLLADGSVPPLPHNLSAETLRRHSRPSPATTPPVRSFARVDYYRCRYCQSEIAFGHRLPRGAV